MADTKIEWSQKVWNPIAGCSVVSPGCKNCYAMRMAARLAAMGQAKYQGLTTGGGSRARWTGKIATDDAALKIPFGWKKPRMIFVNSMSDLFHKNVSVEFIDKVFEVMWACPQHTFQILTKRPKRMVTYVRERAYRQSFGWTDRERTPMKPGHVAHYDDITMRNQCGWKGESTDEKRWVCDHPENEERGLDESCHCHSCPIASPIDERDKLVRIGVADDYKFDDEGFAEDCEWMEIHSRPRHALPGNVWFGFSAENQATYTKRMQEFRPMRWVSAHIKLFCSFEPLLGPIETKIKYWDENETASWNSLETHDFSDGGGPLHVPYLNWGIIGCESGNNRRPMPDGAAESLVDQLRAAGVAAFVKQVEVDGKVCHDIDLFPKSLQVREFPEKSDA